MRKMKEKPCSKKKIESTPSYGNRKKVFFPKIPSFTLGSSQNPIGGRGVGRGREFEGEREREDGMNPGSMDQTYRAVGRMMRMRMDAANMCVIGGVVVLSSLSTYPPIHARQRQSQVVHRVHGLKYIDS